MNEDLVIGSVWKSKVEYEKALAENQNIDNRTFVLVLGKTGTGCFLIHITREYDSPRDALIGPYREWNSVFLTSWFTCVHDGISE